MRPLVWWVQDHLGLSAAGLLGVAVVVVAIVIATSGGSSKTPSPASKVAADGSTKVGRGAGGAQASGDQAGGVAGEARPGSRRRLKAAAARRRRAARRRAAGSTRAGGVDASTAAGDKSATKGGSQAAGGATGGPHKPQQPGGAGQHSLSQATAEKVAAAHPGATCPKSYSTRQCEEAVQAAAEAAPPTAVTQPSDCTKAMSEAQCEELFAAEAAARAAGTGSVSIQECMEHPEQEKCAAVVEEMKAQYEAAHPGG